MINMEARAFVVHRVNKLLTTVECNIWKEILRDAGLNSSARHHVGSVHMWFRMSKPRKIRLSMWHYYAPVGADNARISREATHLYEQGHVPISPCEGAAEDEEAGAAQADPQSDVESHLEDMGLSL